MPGHYGDEPKKGSRKTKRKLKKAVKKIAKSVKGYKERGMGEVAEEKSQSPLKNAALGWAEMARKKDAYSKSDSRASKRMDKKAVLSTPDRKSYDKKGRELDPKTGRPKRKGTRSTLHYTKMKEGTKSRKVKKANKRATKKGEIGKGY